MVTVPEYALVRFQMRADKPDANRHTVTKAWADAEVTWSGGYRIREERYSEEYNITMIAVGGRLKTILRGDTNDETVREDYCEWCGKLKCQLGSCRKCNGWKL